MKVILFFTVLRVTVKVPSEFLWKPSIEPEGRPAICCSLSRSSRMSFCLSGICISAFGWISNSIYSGLS